MASNNLEVTEQREEQTGHHTDSPAMVPGTELPQTVPVHSDTTSRRAPEPRGDEQVHLSGPLHREASQSLFPVQPDPRPFSAVSEPQRYLIPPRTSSSKPSNGILPASPTVRAYQETQLQDEREGKEEMVFHRNEIQQKEAHAKYVEIEQLKEAHAKYIEQKDVEMQRLKEAHTKDMEQKDVEIEQLKEARAKDMEQKDVEIEQLKEVHAKDMEQKDVEIEQLKEAHANEIRQLSKDVPLFKDDTQGREHRAHQQELEVGFAEAKRILADRTWYNTLLVTNIYQAHLRKLRCWGCLQRVDKRTNSHAYGEGVLKAAASLALKMPAKTIIKEQLFWLHGPCSASKCTLPVLRECLCHKCDSSTSDWEKALHNQFGKQRIILTMKGMNEDITELVLLMQVFRGAMMSIDGAHMLSCLNCERYSQQVLCTMLYLAKLHRFVCENFEHKPKEHNETEEQKKVYLSTIKDARNRCKQLPAVVRHTTEHIDVHQIEYPLVAIVPDIGPVIYAQIVPYYIVIPTVRENIGKLDDIQLRKIIDGVNIELDYRHREFYDSNEGGRNWKDSLFKKNCRPMLVFPYHNQCCIQLS